ncbi:MAG: C69 family dipeptidase, partial [Pirellulales bacterium]|nr:C69 family dipeptidase [Pirellulales bacterium]
EDTRDPRRWAAFQAITGKDQPIPPGEPIPLAIRLGKKLSVKDVADVLRNRKSERHISETRTLEMAIFQLRQDMPPAVGCVYWRTTCEPSSGVLLPWYVGITSVPDEYAAPQPLAERLTDAYHFNPPESLFEPNDRLVWWTFHRLQDWVHEDYNNRIGGVRPQWAQVEQKLFDHQRKIEKEAMDRWQTTPGVARWLLTQYCTVIAEDAKTAADAKLYAAKQDEEKK